MIEPRLLKIKTSLATQMSRPGGRTVADVERLANEGLAKHKGGVIASIDKRITDLERLVGAQATGTQDQVYPLASGLLDTGGFFDSGPLYDAGYSLCEVADLMTASGHWHWPSVEVHVRALRLILTKDCKADATSDALMAGLRSIVARARAVGT